MGMPSCFWGKALPATGKRPVGVERGMSGDAEVPGRFGARGGLFTYRRLIQTAVMSMERCWTSAANSPKVTLTDGR